MAPRSDRAGGPAGRLRPLLAAGGLLTLLACGEARAPSFGRVGESNPAPRATLLRLPRDGGAAQLHRLPGLKRAEWESRGALPPLRRVVGADLDQRMVYLVDQKGQVLTLDLQTGRSRAWEYLGGTRRAVIGPDGTFYAVDEKDSVTQVIRRNRVRLSGRLPAPPRHLFGTAGDQLLALVPGQVNRLAVVDREHPIEFVPLPDGDAAATFWGDLVAVAADTAVVLYEPRSNKPVRAIEAGIRAKSVVFSPSGHHLYVAGDDDVLVVVDRYGEEVLGEVDLPGAAGELRADPSGRWLLIRPPKADSTWVVDLATRKYVGAWAARWSEDLPAVAGARTLLVRRGRDLVAYDLEQGPKEVGRVPGGAEDLWLALSWSPETPAEEEATDTLEVATGDSVPRARVYLQLSSSQNPAWASDLARQLENAGLPASVLPPRKGEDGYRVVLGPYASRDEAEEAGRRLGRPFFIYQPDEPQTP